MFVLILGPVSPTELEIIVKQTLQPQDTNSISFQCQNTFAFTFPKNILRYIVHY